MYKEVLKQLEENPRSWVVTGCAGFIGSHLTETLLRSGQKVAGIDNFATGRKSNLEFLESTLNKDEWARFTFIEGDINSEEDLKRVCTGADVILHQAALGSVPRSIANPVASTVANVNGFVNVVKAAVDAGIFRMVYASSSSVYGDSPVLPKVEDNIGKPLSPYAASKYADEVFAHAASHCYPLELVGLRYFNVYGPRQDPNGPYAAVIPKWFDQLLSGEQCKINGDGTTSRDFCFVGDAVQANILSGVTENPEAVNTVYNVSRGGETSLTELFYLIRDLCAEKNGDLAEAKPEYGPFREGDVKHSRANVSRAEELLGYKAQFTVEQGLHFASEWYLSEGGKS